jgi:hypothetical protein
LVVSVEAEEEDEDEDEEEEDEEDEEEEGGCITLAALLISDVTEAINAFICGFSLVFAV